MLRTVAHICNTKSAISSLSLYVSLISDNKLTVFGNNTCSLHWPRNAMKRGVRCIAKFVRLSNRLSVRPSVRHTRESRLNGSRYGTKLQTIRHRDVSSFFSTNFAILNSSVNPSECVKERLLSTAKIRPINE